MFINYFYFISSQVTYFFSPMSLFNNENQGFYDVINGQVNISIDIFNDFDIYPIPAKKNSNEPSTEQGPDYLENRSEMISGLSHQNQTQNNDSSQVVIDNQKSPNDNFSEVLQCDFAQFSAESLNENFEDSNNYNQYPVQTISSQENSDDIFNQLNEEKLKAKTEKNDSKNVPKGMMKAFAHMILDKKPATVQIMKRYFEQQGLSYQKYQQYVRKIRKSSKISIQDIRDMLLHDEFAATTRKLGIFFIRKRFFSHIFNSKMEKRQIHMKYIPRWLQIFKDPTEFRSLK